MAAATDGCFVSMVLRPGAAVLVSGDISVAVDIFGSRSNKYPRSACGLVAWGVYYRSVRTSVREIICSNTRDEPSPVFPPTPDG